MDTLPTMEQLRAEAKRDPIGRTLTAVCRDLGVAPFLCDVKFWNRLFPAIHYHGGNFAGYLLEMRRLEIRFEKEDWKHPGLDWPEETREGARRVLGFFIGETPVDPWATVPEAATTAATEATATATAIPEAATPAIREAAAPAICEATAPAIPKAGTPATQETVAPTPAVAEMPAPAAQATSEATAMKPATPAAMVVPGAVAATGPP